MKTIQSIRGMNDLFGAEAVAFQNIIQVVDRLFSEYQFEPMVLPIVEKTELFARGIGGATDIIEKEMYTFLDRNEESLSLRPEGTAGCVRACLEHGLIHNQIRKFWYYGPMFRHERPQKGRYRQFYQVGAEIFGIATPDVEAETISMLYQLWQSLGILKHVRLEINTIGTLEERRAYRQHLLDYLKTYQNQLDEDSKRRLETNPLRILDSKDPETQALLENAPKLYDCLSEDSKTHFEKFKSYLNALNISYHINPKLVRGLDYYCHTVFEWTTDLLGAQATICGGGRYDGLVAELGGQATPAFGFALGIERLMLVAEQVGFKHADKLPATFIMTDDDHLEATIALAANLRATGIHVALNTGGGSFKSQRKRAEKSGAPVILTLRSNRQDPEKASLDPEASLRESQDDKLNIEVQFIKQNTLMTVNSVEELITLLKKEVSCG